MRLVVLLALLFTSVISAADKEIIKKESVVILASNEVHNGDFFAVGRSVEISGTVNGDLYVLSGQVIIDGVVNGDVLAVGGSIVISGKVTHNCRLVGGQVLVSGEIGNNVSVLSGNLQLLSTASLGGSLVAASAIVDTAASIQADATLVAANVRVSSYIHQNLQGYVGKLRITSKSVIDGDVDYRSNTPASIDEGALILGTVIYRPSIVHKIMNTTWIHQLFMGSKVLVTLMNFIYTFVVGVLLIKLFPTNLTAALHSLNQRPLKSFFYGVLLVILLPLVFLLLLITILGVPFALALMAFNIMGFYTAKVYSILWTSNWIGGKVGMQKNSLWSFFCTVIIYFGLGAVPVLGSILALVAMLFGLGAGITAQNKHGVFSQKS